MTRRVIAVFLAAITVGVLTLSSVLYWLSSGQTSQAVDTYVKTPGGFSGSARASMIAAARCACIDAKYPACWRMTRAGSRARSACRRRASTRPWSTTRVMQCSPMVRIAGKGRPRR